MKLSALKSIFVSNYVLPYIKFYPMKIRLANQQDSAAIHQVFRAAFTPFQAHYTTDSFASTVVGEAVIQQRMEQGRTWVAEEGGQLLGTVSVAEYWEGFYVTGMAVSPHAQGKKLAYRLMRTLENYAIGQGAERMFLYTTPFLQRAVSLYEKLGFTRYGNPADEWMGTNLIQFEKAMPPAHFDAEKQGANGYETVLAKPEDLDFVCYLFEEAMAFQKRKGYPVWLGYDRGALAREIEEGKTYKILVGNVVACTFSALFSDKIYWREKDQDDAIYLHRIVVNPMLRGQSHFAKVLAWAKAEAAKKGRRYLRMDTWAANPKIIKLYEGYGFRFIENYTTPDTEEISFQYRKQRLALLEMDLGEA